MLELEKNSGKFNTPVLVAIMSLMKIHSIQEEAAIDFNDSVFTVCEDVLQNIALTLRKTEEGVRLDPIIVEYFNER